MNSYNGELRLADGTPVRIVGRLPEWTPVVSEGPRAKWDSIETDVYVDGGATFTLDDIKALSDKMIDHYTWSEAYFHVSQQTYWYMQYAAQGKRYPSPKKRKSQARMSRKWRGIA